MTVVNVNKDVMNSASRIVTVNAITKTVDSFGLRNGLEMHYSGLPLIRTKMATKVSVETTWFLLGSVVYLSTIILLIFFRSISTMLLCHSASLITGVIFSLGTAWLLAWIQDHPPECAYAFATQVVSDRDPQLYLFP